MMDDFYTNHSDNFRDSDYSSNNNKGILSVLVVIEHIVILTGLPLVLLAIVAVFFLARKDHGAPVYIINLLISDLIQLCCLAALKIHFIDTDDFFIIGHIYTFGLMASVGFMLCISLERYLVVTKPLWYRFRRDIRITVLVCVVVWTLPLIYVLPLCFKVDFQIITVFAVFLLILFLLFIFFLVGTLKALPSADSLPHDEKRRIVSMLVAVLLIYTLLFLPYAIWCLVKEAWNNMILFHLVAISLYISPLADVTLYFFIRKGTVDELLRSLCCKMSNRQETENTNNEVISGLCTEAV